MSNRNTKHTPEILEYTAERSGGEIVIELGIGVAIADRDDELSDIPALENTARLIAAAPELLEALRECLSCIDQHADDPVVGPIIERANKALAKATGDES